MPTKIKGTSGIDKVEAGAVITNPTFSGNATVTGTLTVDSNASINGSNISTQPTFRNLIINGNMTIDQRNAGASVTITTGGGYIYPVDRFGNFNNSGTNYTAQQVVDAPAGFYQSTKLTFASAISLSSQNEATFFQIVEGLNVADLGWGTAAAQTISVSLWVKASFTGTFSIGFANNAGTRTYATTYTITTADTWEYKTFTISGDTSGTWLKTNGSGLYVRWNIIAGSNFQVSSNDTWATRTGAYNAADGTYGTKAIGSASSISAGATWQITGVQLEVGTTATDFENLQYGQQLALCQRYYYKSPESYSYGDTFMVYQANTGFLFNGRFPVTMRTNPSVTFGWSTKYTGNTIYRIDSGQVITMTVTSLPTTPDKVSLIYQAGTHSLIVGTCWSTWITASSEL